MADAAPPDPFRGLDPGDELWLRRQTDRVHGLFRRAAEDVLQIGAAIAEVKARLGHGAYLAWVAAALPFTAETARKMAAAAEAFGDRVPAGAALDPTALYVLSQPSTSPEARAKALELAAGGHRVTAAVARAIIRGLAAAAEHEPRPARTFLPPDTLRLLIPDGQREARFDLTLRIDPDGDLIVGVGGESGRDLAAVLGQLADRVRHAPKRVAVHDDADPALLDWCDGIAGGIARQYRVSPGDQRWDEIRGTARRALVECCRDFDPARVKPDSTEEDAFRGWAKQTIRRECHREAERLINGGLYHTKRRELAAPKVVPLADDR